jgi:hypothetical protein
MNMMKYCPECYKELPPNSAVCPFCGYRTGNGQKEEEELTPSVVLQTPRVDSYLPPEQAFLGLLLIFVFFWGISLTSVGLPIFFNAASPRNLLIALISSQVIIRAIIGIWAVQEVSLKNKPTIQGKIGTFLLSFIPIGDIYPSLHAARTVIRKDHLSILSIASIAAVAMMTLVLFNTSDQILNIVRGIDIKDGFTFNTLAAETTTLTEEETEETQAALVEPTKTIQPYINGCRNPLMVTADEDGEFLEVCGEITNFGVKDCPTCPLGYYSFVRLNGKFQVVSYEWRFTHAWLNKCVRIQDTLQLLGGIPAFVFNVGEGCIGDCVHDFHGGLIDDGGEYFKPFEGCDG